MSDRPDLGRGPTLRDVALRSGVAVSTASRALTRPGRVGAQTEARVRAVAEELGYVPSASARALTSGRTRTVALVVPDTANPLFFGMVRGVQSRLRDAGFVHVLADTEESVEREEQVMAELRGSVDGVVLAAPRADEASVTAWAEEFPVVTVNRDVPGPRVLIDTAGGVVHALQHLASLGHRRVAYAGGPRRSWSDRQRREALIAAAGGLDVELVVTGPYVPRREGGPAAADATLLHGCSAVIAFNDLLAFGILDRFAERGTTVPDEVSVVGCDDIFGTDLVRPGLTTVAVPVERAGAAAADLLLRRLAAGARGGARVVELPTHLVVRGSTGSVPR
ncbi:LacI family DNA-binding transcriptional regulator [Actinotalea sp. BY-33]|uniref:LacI family DNA-binding transcriptional regulator n=1 Tax=Actinotalea soli TaxID=2819234 RepID=A0A939LQL2_9CELL|nr:LacI family DNA-binding transcriptional regulator [Actinotalea soli]MBO1752626.1 LacI family DNA-binding transcriptional regulator [Actinotalea soli]